MALHPLHSLEERSRSSATFLSSRGRIKWALGSPPEEGDAGGGREGGSLSLLNLISVSLQPH